jgi:hypothetical protein
MNFAVEQCMSISPGSQFIPQHALPQTQGDGSSGSGESKGWFLAHRRNRQYKQLPKFHDGGEREFLHVVVPMPAPIRAKELLGHCYPGIYPIDQSTQPEVGIGGCWLAHSLLTQCPEIRVPWASESTWI